MRKYKKMNKVLAFILFLSFTFAQPLAVLAETLSAEAPAPVIAIEKTETTQVAETPIVSAEEKVETKTIPDSNNPVTQNPIPTQTVVPVSVSTAIVDPTSASLTVSETSSSSVEAREDEAVKTIETINPEEAITEEEELAPLDLGDNKTELDAKKDLTAIVRQSKDYYCGPAALATLLTQLGEDVSELQVVENIPADELVKDKGTNLLALKNAAKKLDQTVFLKKWNAEQVLRYIQETGDPVLIHDEKKNVGGHFSVIKAYSSETKTTNEAGQEKLTPAQVEISDTEAGNIKYSVEDFKHIYTGHVLIISSDKNNDLLNNSETKISDEEAATIWGMYVPVYMLAYSSGDKEANDAANAYVLCTNKAMQIVNKEQRNTERAKCYQKLGTGVGDGLNALQEAKLATEYYVDTKIDNAKINEGAIGTSTILGALNRIKEAQAKYIEKNSYLNTRISQLGGMTVAQAQNLSALKASLASQIAQISYDKTLLEKAISPKQKIINDLEKELNDGKFVKDGQTFSLGAVNNQLKATKSTFDKLSSALSGKLNSLDGQISNAKKQKTTAENDKRNAQNNANYYQGQADSYKNTASSYSKSADNAYKSYKNAVWWKKPGLYSDYLWYKARQGYYSGLAAAQEKLASGYRWYADYYQGKINDLNGKIAQWERDKNNARSEVNNANSNYASTQRLLEFGEKEKNRKKSDLAKLKDELNYLQGQLYTRIVNLTSLNTQLTSVKNKESAAAEIIKINSELSGFAASINTDKSRYGFTTITYTNTAETTRLIQEELDFERKQDDGAKDLATTEKTILDQIVVAVNSVTDAIIGEGVAVVINGVVYRYNSLPQNVRNAIEAEHGKQSLRLLALDEKYQATATLYSVYSNYVKPILEKMGKADEKITGGRTIQYGQFVLTIAPFAKVAKGMIAVKEATAISAEAKAIGIEARAVGYVTEEAAAKATVKVAIKSSELIFSAEKIVPQMAERGWTKESVKALVDNPYTTRVATNKALNNPATVFYAKDGTHVVVDDLTKQVVQVTDNAQVLKGQWYLDNSIVNPYRP